jgi:3-(3-hydroxy-phenyl)propionate hydroxylase
LQLQRGNMGGSLKFDVVILGYGPVGALGAALMAKRGWQVAVIDRMPDVYPLPRAVRFDEEAMRMFQELGIADEMNAASTPLLGAEFIDVEKRRLEGFELPADMTGASGWPISNMFHQPLMERTLRNAVDSYDNVTVFLSHEAALPDQTDDKVSVEISPIHGGDALTLEADYLIAADGAASPVRKSLGIEFLSLGYDCDWVVVDVLLKRDVPTLSKITQQICDPARIVTYVPVVGMRRRWEFRLHPDEVKEEMVDDDTIWGLLKPWVGPEDAEIERAAGYQFHAAIADKWRDRRIFLAGDAAHQTPPFLGEGMCAGLRDVANLAWKLDMVWRGLADDNLLETYQQERGPHALDLVDHAVETGKLMDQIAAAHNTGDWPTSYAAAYGGSRGYPHLHGGVLALQDDDPTDGITGFQTAQPRVDLDGRGAQRLDDLTDERFYIVSEKDQTPSISAENAAFLSRIDAKHFVLEESKRTSPELNELLGRYDALIVRPDRYVFGVVDEKHPINQQLDKLRVHFK